MISAELQNALTTNEVLLDTINGLMGLMAKSQPLLTDDLKKLGEQLQNNMGVVRNQFEENFLKGNGTRALAGKNAVVPKEVKNPITQQEVTAQFLKRVALGTNDEGQPLMLVPTAADYGSLVAGEMSTEEANRVDPTKLADGIYVVKQDDKVAGFFLKLVVDRQNIFLASSQGDVSVSTYVPAEDVWFKHRQWKYLDKEKLTAKMDELFADTVGDFKLDSERLAPLFNDDGEDQQTIDFLPGLALIATRATGNLTFELAGAGDAGRTADDYSNPQLNATLKRLLGEVEKVAEVPVAEEVVE